MDIISQTATRPQAAPRVAELTGYDAGYAAFYRNKKRSTLTPAEQRGWDDAHGEYCYHMAMIKEGNA